MKKIKPVLTFVFAVFIVVGGINLFLKPQMYLPFVPFSLPSLTIIYSSGAVEILLGVGALIGRTRKVSDPRDIPINGNISTFAMVDVFKENPAIGNHMATLFVYRFNLY